MQSPRLQYSLDYRHEDRDGTGLHAGAFITLSTILPEPIDYATDEIDAKVSYLLDKGQVDLAYYGSFFNSQDPGLLKKEP